MLGNWKHIAKKISLGLLLAVVLIGSYILGSARRENILCNKIEINILDSIKTPFVTSESIREYLKTDYGKLLGVPVDSIDLFKIERVLNEKTAVLTSEAYVTSKGVLNISIAQRTPALRFQTQKYGFYCDINGRLLPLQPNFCTDVVIIDGNIPLDTTDCRKGRPVDPQDCIWLDKILSLVTKINSSIWRDRIAQINCDDSGELTIVPKEGKEIFIFGHPDKIQEKLEKMQVYYERIVAEKGPDAYNVVDLRFNKQIVCKNTEQKKKQ